MDSMQLLNPWWKEAKVNHLLAKLYKRKALIKLKHLMKFRQITIISGLRRVGKSTLMYQIIEQLLESKVKAENIFYYTFDEKVDTISALLSNYQQLTTIDWKKEKCYIFFDEIQKFPNWSNQLKMIYDSFPQLKIIISGSSSFELEKEAKLNLAGRHFVVNVEPLTFIEYLELKQSKIDLNKQLLWEEEIKREFQNYLIRPFPEIVDYQDISLIRNYIRDNIIEKVVKIDLYKKFGYVNIDLITRLIDLFYDNPGSYINYDELSSELKVSKKTLLLHIYYLEFAYVIRRIHNYRPNTRTVTRKLQRIYPYHWSLQFAWNGNINVETITATFFDAKYYWRKEQKEVDFLIIKEKDIIPIEVKEAKLLQKSELSSFYYFINKFKSKQAIIIYNGKEAKETVNKTIVKKIPLFKLFL